MRRKAYLSLILILLLLLSGCSLGGPAPEGKQTKELTDMLGRTVSIQTPVERVVVLTAADCEIISALGCESLLVGRGEYCDYPASVLEIPSVQSGYETNIEQIIALNPQVVVMGSMDQWEEQAQALSQAGIATVFTDAQSIEGVYQAITFLGDVLDRPQQAQQLVEEMQNTFAEIRDKAGKHQNKGSVYFEVSPLEYGLWTAGQDTFMDEIATLLGLNNIFADMKGWGEISQEQVIARRPDYIVTVTMYFGEGPRPEEEIAARKGWESIPAVEQGNIIHSNSDEITRPGPRLAEAAARLYERIYQQAE